MKIEEPFSISGYFWLPSDEDNKLYGTLTVEDGGKIELEILGKFPNNSNINIIVGKTERGHFVLEKCFVLTHNIQITNPVKNRLLITTMYKNITYIKEEKNEKILFDTFSFTVDGLNEWLNIKKIKTDEDNFNKKFIIKNEELEKFRFNVTENIILEFLMSLSINYKDYDVSMKQSSRIKLISNKKEPLDYFIEIANKIVKFLSLAIDESINIKDIEVTDSNIFNELNGKKYPIEIEVYGSIMHFFKDVPKIEFYTMLFQYTNIQDSFEEKINNWIKSYSVIESALNLFFSVRYNPSQYVESEFLSLTQALETYHRQLYKTDKNFKERVVEIMNPFKEYIGSDEVIEELSKKIKITRNYYTHYDDKNRDKAIPRRELSSLSRRIEGILQLAFLTQIGFNKVEIKKIFDGYSGLKNKF